MTESHVGDMLKQFVDALPSIDSSTSSFAERLTSKADFMLVTCIDYRYPQIVQNYMRKEHPGRVYDQLTLAGASLAASEGNTGKSDWKRTFVDHISFAIEHHQIDGVLILDHRTCGAYREFGLLTKEQENTEYEADRHDEVSTGVAEALVEVFRQHGRPGVIHAYLTPEVTDPSAPDFPSRPQFLCERRA